MKTTSLSTGPRESLATGNRGVIGTLFLAYFLNPLAEAGAQKDKCAPRRAARASDCRGLWGFWLIAKSALK